MLLKRWSEQCGVNNAAEGYLSTYAVNLLWVHFLVRHGHVRHVDPSDVAYVASTALEAWLPAHAPLPTPDDGDAAVEALGALLLDFFAFYAQRFDWATEVVSVNRAGPTTKAMLGWWHQGDNMPTTATTGHAMCVEDPYEDGLNLLRRVGDGRRHVLVAAFQRGLLALAEASPLPAGGPPSRRL